ncbi:hypothetical protein DXA41_16050 [Coprobacillus cateniformis]|nr:hypothetical protein DXA41_16050 [Coprobacillus cateniformis]RHT80387.1 hypothetical protein DW725_14540 [Clostridiaceae bacterium AM27-36LB]
MTVDWLGWLCYLPDVMYILFCTSQLSYCNPLNTFLIYHHLFPLLVFVSLCREDNRSFFPRFQ